MKTIEIAIAMLALGCGANTETRDLFIDDTGPALETGNDVGSLNEALHVSSIDFGFLPAGMPENRCVVGARCYVPRDKKLRFKMGFDTTFAAGFTMSQAFAAEAASTCGVLNAHGWDCATTTGTSNEVLDNNDLPGLTFGKANIHNISGTVITAPPAGSYQEFNACDMTVSKNNIEFDGTYQTLSTANKLKAVRNVMKHLFGHCAGLPDNNQGIMRDQNFDLDNGSFLFEELGYWDAFVP